ncbi:alpha/beta hydrolase [Pannus brasiliensis CCIBt3594]|uniref:Alpha/beta hydrolase n=1 Tax=Pannus brasiliensis CCIBt3594 TaxID=1427578 RepID=A0AAW9QY97_9CHRO
MTLLTSEQREGFLTTNGIRLHYVSQGQGKLMLFLHGFPEFWYSWRHQLPEFAKDYHAVAIDLRGYNDSDKPPSRDAYSMEEFVKDIDGAITGLGYEDCILVAHDWGGAIAWVFAYEYPHRVEKLIVLNIPHPAKFLKGLFTSPQIFRSWYIFFFQLPLLPELWLKKNNYRTIANIFSEMAIDKSAFSPEDLEAYKNAAAKEGALTAMVNYYRGIFSKFPSSSQIPTEKLDIPTLMIWGEEDTALGKELTYGTEEYVRDFTVKYIPDCSHWVQQERPDLVNQYIREFLARD